MNIKNIIRTIFVTSTIMLSACEESENSKIQFRDCNPDDVEIKIFGVDLEPMQIPEDPNSLCILNTGPSNDPAQSGNVITWCNNNLECCIADLSLLEYSCNF